ncbi:MAG TPA: hypothetical protein VGF60_22285 [Xanthobacteraceae bacterium]
MTETIRARPARAPIRGRHVIYVEGYDPQGAEGYYRLFQRSWRWFLEIWPIKAELGPLELESQDFAHWNLHSAAPNWRVATRYDFLRQEHIVRANMAEPLLRRQLPRALGWALDYLLSGALVRVFHASLEFGLALVHFQTQVIFWIANSLLGGGLAALAALHAGLPAPAAAAIGIAVAAALFVAGRLLARRTFVIQINSHWPYLCEFARGEPSCFDAPVEAGAHRVIAAARANEADEIVVVGHSGGGVLAPAVITRALELDPDVGRRGPALVLLTLGSIAPGAALHPRAERLRAIFARLAIEPSVAWIDCQSRKDVLNFWDFDPIEGVGVRLGRERCNPLVWKVRFRDMVSSEFYRRIRINYFRLHYQFIMANDQRASYDYFMLIGGPLPVATWAKDPNAALAAFAADGALTEHRAAAAATPA